MIPLLALAALLVLLLLGVPAFAAIGLVAASLLLAEGESVGGIAQVVLDHLNSPTLTALPFFIIAAIFLQRGGLAAAMIDMTLAWMGRVRGGLAYVTVLASTAFSTLSGSSVATALSVGTVVLPEMERRNYPKPFALGLIGASGTLGILLPPSLALIIFGLVTGVSIPKLFLAGVVPGLLQAGLLLVSVLIAGRLLKLPAGEPTPRRERIAATVRAAPALGIAAVLFGGIYGGLITTTEAAAVTAILSIAASLLIYKGVTPATLLPTLADGLSGAARIVMIVGSALLLSHWLVLGGVAQEMVGHLTHAGIRPWQFLLLVNLILLVLGIVLEGVSTILVVTPLIAPLLQPMGVDPLHFAIIMVVNIEIAMLHPPLGMNLFVLAGIGKCSTAEVIRGIWPFVVLMLAFLVLITFAPVLSTWLPNLIFSR